MTILRFTAKIIVLVGIYMLIRVLYLAAAGELAPKMFPRFQSPWLAALAALALSLPVPLHVMGIGLIIQRRWLSPVWSKIAWLAVIISGCWLGLALGFQLFFLS